MGTLGNDLLTIAAVAGLVCTGLVLVAAGAQKLRHWPLLAGVIGNYRLLPRGLVAPAAWALPPLELGLGLALLSGAAGRFLGAAPLVAMLLLAGFAAAMAVNLKRGRGHIDCGCGQPFLRQHLRWSLVARNILLMTALLPSLAVYPAAPPAAFMAGICAGAAFFMLYVLGNTLAALPVPEAAR